MKSYRSLGVVLLALLSCFSIALGADLVHLSVDQAKQEGLTDGNSDGGREGSERGPQEGREQGLDAGRRAGFEKCSQEAHQNNFDRGYRDGLIRGRQSGELEGNQNGAREGDIQGERDGLADGFRRADADAIRNATPAGTAKGIDEAERSDAADRGYRDGGIAGDREAHERALNYDYPRGRQEYRKERYQEPILNQDEFNQTKKPGTNGFQGELTTTSALPPIASLTSPGVPDDRYYNPKKTYPTPEETSAYKTAYRSGYTSGFRRLYTPGHDAAYRQGYDRGYPIGCREGENQNFKPDYDRGFREGFDSGYRQAYQQAFNHAFRLAYDSKFRIYSERAYRDNYQGFYNKHFEIARQQAYAARVTQLYNAAYAQARTQKFNEVYPRYAQEQSQRGRQDEAAEFAAKPVRLVSVVAIESEPNGVMEPGEPITLKVQLRNFAESAVAGKDVKVKIEALDPSSAVISTGEALLIRDLKNKSLTTVNRILEFRFNESALNKLSRFRVLLSYQGKLSGEDTLDLTSKYQLGVRFESAPELHEGLPATLQFKVKNDSNLTIADFLNLKLTSPSGEIEIVQGEAKVSSLSAGEERIVPFIVIARAAGNSMRFPIAIEALSGKRRVGAFYFNESVPVLNDYKVTIKGELDGLRSSGTVRALYEIEDQSPRSQLRGLQLIVRIKGDAMNSVQVMGPHPQYLKPLVKGEKTSFVIPFAVTANNSGGTLELEVQEDGRTVVIHRIEF
ncbi:MAG: hypothetical protein AABZ55_11280 [Bdellovibrionota bacterium]